ncbi:MAG: hypothetical protein KatS3mg023_2147 [Armatimonadota bacterium]|nr:MAG: hypothetical protein KatS3mg023_2147 [Armatimonadota bacterium]
MHRSSCLGKIVFSCLTFVVLVVLLTCWQMGIFTTKVTLPCLLSYNDYSSLYLIFDGQRFKLPLYTQQRTTYYGVSFCFTPRELLFYYSAGKQIGVLPSEQMSRLSLLLERKHTPLMTAVRWISIPKPFQGGLLLLQNSTQTVFLTGGVYDAPGRLRYLIFTSPLSAPDRWERMGQNVLSVRAHPGESHFATLDRRGFIAVHDASGRIHAKMMIGDIVERIVDWDVDFTRNECFLLIRHPFNAVVRCSPTTQRTFRLTALFSPHHINVCEKHGLVLVTGYAFLITHAVIMNAYDYEGRWQGQVRGVSGAYIVPRITVLDALASSPTVTKLVETALRERETGAQ